VVAEAAVEKAVARFPSGDKVHPLTVVRTQTALHHPINLRRSIPASAMMQRLYRMESTL
jgi:hypothetical protein